MRGGFIYRLCRAGRCLSKKILEGGDVGCLLRGGRDKCCSRTREMGADRVLMWGERKRHVGRVRVSRKLPEQL